MIPLGKKLRITPPGLDRVPELVIVPMLSNLPLFVRIPPELTVMVSLGLTVTTYVAGMVTVIPFGITTASDGPGIVPPHVAVLFQFPLATAVKEIA